MTARPLVEPLPAEYGIAEIRKTKRIRITEGDK